MSWTEREFGKPYYEVYRRERELEGVGKVVLQGGNLRYSVSAQLYIDGRGPRLSSSQEMDFETAERLAGRLEAMIGVYNSEEKTRREE